MASPSFKSVITSFAEYMEWDEAKIEPTQAAFTIEAEDGAELEVYISVEDEVVYFDIPSDAGFDSEEEIPGDMAVQLLTRTALLGFGAWCADEYDDGWYFAVKWALDLPTLANMEHEALAGVLGAMADEVAEFNDMFEDDDEAD